MKQKTRTKKSAREWADQDNAQAEKEGWAVFEAHGGQEIEADSESNRFMRKGVFRDDLAVEHVCKRALAGSRLHVRALVVHLRDVIDIFKTAHGYDPEEPMLEAEHVAEMYRALKGAAEALGVTDDPAGSRRGELADAIRTALHTYEKKTSLR